MSDAQYIETIAFMGRDIELTRKGFLNFLENNKEIRLIDKPRSQRNLRAVGKDRTYYFTINPIGGNIMREIAGQRIDQLILCDDKRKIIYIRHREIINAIRSRFTGQIPEEYQILFYEY